MARPPAPPLPLTPTERARLADIAASVSLPYRAVREAKGLLMAGDGLANTRIATDLGVSRSTVIQWREHFELDGIEWVGKVRPGRGRKPVITQDVIDKMIVDTQTTVPSDATHWSNRTMANYCGLSRTTVQREWKARGLKPHLVKTFKLSNDPNFEDKLIDVVGLYMNPPDHAIVLSFRREVTDPGVGPYPAEPADEAGPSRDSDARLQTERHHDPVRRSQRSDRPDDREVLLPPPPRGVPGFPEDHRPRGSQGH